MKKIVGILFIAVIGLIAYNVWQHFEFIRDDTQEKERLEKKIEKRDKEAVEEADEAGTAAGKEEVSELKGMTDQQVISQSAAAEQVAESIIQRHRWQAGGDDDYE